MVGVSGVVWARMKRLVWDKRGGSRSAPRSFWEREVERRPIFFSPKGGSGKMRSNSSPAAASWPMAVKAARLGDREFSRGRGVAAQFSPVLKGGRFDFFMLQTRPAPRLRNSK